MVTVNEALITTYLPNGTTNFSKTQPFNKSFNSTPRVVLSMLGYGQVEPATNNLRLGFNVTITSVSLSGFSYNVTTYDVVTVLLRYNYLGIQFEQTSFYTDIKHLTCTPSNTQSPQPAT